MEFLGKKRINTNSFKVNRYYNSENKNESLIKKEIIKNNNKNLSNKEDKFLIHNNHEDNKLFYNYKQNLFYYSNDEKILYLSNKLNKPKTFHSSFNNLKFYCSYNSFKNNKSYNEDKILISCQNNSNEKIHLFAIFDGHGGGKCSKYLMNNFDKILFSNKNLMTSPSKSLKEAYLYSENKFKEINKPKNLLIEIEKSGSCALTMLSIGKKIYCANAGDSRSLYSENGSKEIYQISFEHKPQNEIKRIIKAGGSVNCCSVIGNIWRLFPGGIAVRNFFIKFIYLDFKINWRFSY